MSQPARIRRSTTLVSLALALLLGLVVAPSSGAHPGAHDAEPSPGIGVVLDPEGAATFQPGFQYTGTPPVADETAPFAFVGNGCTPEGYAGADVAGKIALADESATGVCPPTTFFQRVAYAEQAGAIGLVIIAADGTEPTTNGTAVVGGIPAMEVFRTPEILAALDTTRNGDGVVAQLTDTRTPIPSSGPAECVDGVARSGDGVFEGELVPGVAFECKNVDLLSFVGKDVINSAGISDIWGWTDPEDGGEYVIMGKTNGTAFFDVTDPTAPLYLGEIPNRSPVQQVWHDIKVYDNHAFIVSESERHGMSVFDLTRLRDLGASDGSVMFEPDTVYELTSAAHNLEINTETGFAYIVGGNAGLVAPDQCLSGLHMVDIQDPKTPAFAGCYSAEGGPGTAARTVGSPVQENSPAAYVHDTTCVVYDGPDTEHAGKEICFNSAEDKIVIADVTNKLAPVTLGTVTYENIAYAHQGSLTADQRFLLVNDELDEIAEEGEGDDVPTTRTMVLNVADLDEPVVQYIHAHETTAIDHNNYVHEGFVYQSNYSAGLRVLDVANVDSSLTEVAFFDTYPSHTDPTFDGTWSNYPFFASGTIAVSGREEGLFLLKRSDLGEDDAASVTVTCENCPLEVRPRHSGTAQLAVTNAGDGADVTFGDDVPAGWTVSADPVRVSGDSAQVAVTVDVPARTAAGSYAFTVKVGTASTLVDVVFNKGKPSSAGRR